MSEVLRILAIVVGVAVGLGLLALNKHVAEKYWLANIEDLPEDEED